MVDCQLFICTGNHCCSIPACSRGALRVQLGIISSCPSQGTQCPSLPNESSFPPPVLQVGERRGWAVAAIHPKKFCVQTPAWSFVSSSEIFWFNKVVKSMCSCTLVPHRAATCHLVHKLPGGWMSKQSTSLHPVLLSTGVKRLRTTQEQAQVK